MDDNETETMNEGEAVRSACGGELARLLGYWAKLAPAECERTPDTWHTRGYDLMQPDGTALHSLWDGPEPYDDWDRASIFWHVLDSMKRRSLDVNLDLPWRADECRATRLLSGYLSVLEKAG